MMGDSKSGLDVPLVAIQATEHLEGVIHVHKGLGFHSLQSWHIEYDLCNILLCVMHVYLRDLHVSVSC